MINPLAIAATSATLRKLLLEGIGARDPSLKGALVVSTRPLDLVHRARKDGSPPQLNVFLYHIALNGGWRTGDLPGQAGTGAPALDLRYLISAYDGIDIDNDDNDGAPTSDRVLSAAMSVLHDRPVLSRADIDAALAGQDLAHQLDSLRIMQRPQSVDELHRLWSACQAPYRICAAYEVSVTPGERGRQDPGLAE